MFSFVLPPGNGYVTIAEERRFSGESTVCVGLVGTQGACNTDFDLEGDGVDSHGNPTFTFEFGSSSIPRELHLTVSSPNEGDFRFHVFLNKTGADI